jgi:uncharacterized protein (TIGR03437 family)
LVLGKRSAEVAGNGKTYSRALQANTTHYFRISCGTSVSTGSFATSNIPFGMTYLDLPPVTLPSVLASDPNPIIDPQTGAMVKIAAPATNHDHQSEAYLGSGGYTRVCSNEVVGPANGYMCAFLAGDGGAGVAYYYIPTTGELRYLGSYWIPGNAVWDMNGIGNPTPGRVTYTGIANKLGQQIIIKGTYVGDYSAAAPASIIPMSWTQVALQGTSALGTLKLLNPNINSPAGCGLLSTQDNYGLFDCRSGYQDSYAYAVGVIDLNTGAPVAAMPVMSTAPLRFCGEHNYHFLAPNVPVVELQSHQLYSGTAGPNGVGGGPYTITLATPVDATSTTLNVLGEPLAPNPGDLVMTAQAGDLVLINNAELVKIISKVSATQWVVERGWGGYFTARPHSGGEIGTMQCGGLASADTSPTTPYWTFLNDPLGNNLVINRAWPIGGHDDAGADLHLTEGYNFTKGPILNILNMGPQQQLTVHPSFAGAAPTTDGNSTASHPSYNQINNPDWFVDSRPLNGSNAYSDTHISLGGQLYKYTFAAWYQNSGIHRKSLPTLSFTRGQQLTDISGPGSRIASDASMSNTFCVAQVDNECVSGGKAGEVFGNIPNLTSLYCAGGEGPNPNLHDWCLLDNPPMGQAVMQLGMIPNRVGSLSSDPSYMMGLGWSRTLSRGFGPIRGITPIAKATPDGQYVFFNQVASGNYGPLLMLKVPPFLQQDTTDRTNFVPVTVTVSANAQAAGAVVQFGYAEFGAPDQGYCTTRREACVAVLSSLNTTTPFRFRSTESYTGTPCSSGCQIVIPLAPQHVAYYQVLYLNSSGQLLSVGAQGIATEGGTTSVIPPPGFVQVSPTTVTLSASQTAQFTATLTGFADNSVTWSLSPSVGSISNGLYTAPSSISSSQAVTITATSVADPTKSGTATVQLTPTTNVSVGVSPLSATLSSSQSRQFTATVSGTTNTAVTWSMNPSVGSLSNGLYLAPSIVNSTQTVMITATSAADPTKSASATVQVTPSVSVIVSPLSVTLAASQTYQFAAAVSGTTNTAVTWSLPPSLGTVSNGLYTAPSTISASQNVTITATSVADPSKSATATIQLVANSVSISISPPNATLNSSQSTQITATVTGTTNTGVAWSTPAVGTLSNGLYTAPPGITTAQNVVITATSQADPTKVGSATIQLMPTVSVSLSPTGATLTPSQGSQFTPTVTGTTNTGVTWSMSPSVGSLSNGMYTAPSVITSPQTVTISATSVVDSSKSGTAVVQLVPNSISVILSPANATVIASQSTQFTATVNGTTNTAVTWSTPSVGSLSNGMYTAPSVISGAQTVTLTATSVADPSKFATATVQLLPNNISISLSPPTASLLASQSVQFTATVTGTTNTAVAWSAPTAGTISNGLYTAPSSIKSSDNITLTATSLADSSKFVSAVIHLLPKKINIRMSPQSATVAPSQSVQFTALVDGTSDGTVVWSSAGLGTVSPEGVYTAPSVVKAAQSVLVTGTLLPPDGTPVATSASINVLPSSAGPPLVTWALNAASLAGGPVSAGEILALVGSNIGPDDPAIFTLDASGKVPTTLGNTQVFFDGVPAPLLYVQANQINLVVPYSVTPGATVQVQVEYQGKRSNAMDFAVAPYSPGLFTLGSSQGAIVNEDGTVNGPDNPAARGAWVSLYGTGIGQTDPPGVDGQVVGVPPPLPLLPVTVKIGNVDAPVIYSGSVPGMVSGMLMINVRIPAETPPGDAVPINFAIGDALSQPGVTIAIK